MEKKRKIMQYRERLDRTLASDDLTNVEILKKLVKSQLLPSSELEDEGYKEKLIERKTAEISNFLDMLRSASDDGGLSNTPHNDWKVCYSFSGFCCFTMLCFHDKLFFPLYMRSSIHLDLELFCFVCLSLIDNFLS
ncbi:hypothetical protein KIW84_062403 [Lathyrus oleraceus]|uniref:Uncharacterized protein n=1 Tax=Pisum sativum TaxID=3888 RepID=A0A9D5A3J2_PEA|nr:hypothetical protein KIW84_062403 [Pisum sativum]